MAYTIGVNGEYAESLVFHMPGPQSHEAPWFKGRKIKKFLQEFELLAQSTWLLDVQKCKYIELYCKDREVQFIKTLPRYENKCWSELTESLPSYYPAEDEDKAYCTKDLRRFINLEHKTKRHSDFDKYWCKFWVIAISLEERSHLTEVKMDDYFFHGLKLKSFCMDVKEELRAQRLWKDLSSPPRMEHIVTVVKALLRHDLYYNDQSNDDSDPESGDENKSDINPDSSPHSIDDDDLDCAQSNIEDSKRTSHR